LWTEPNNTILDKAVRNTGRVGVVRIKNLLAEILSYKQRNKEGRRFDREDGVGKEGFPLCSYDPGYIPSHCTVHGVRIANVDTTK